MDMRQQRGITVLVAVACAVLAGCHRNAPAVAPPPPSPPTMAAPPPPPPSPTPVPVPPPPPVAPPHAPTLLEVKHPPRQYVVKVFYGTNRQRTGSDLADRYYGPTDARRLELGAAWVTIPPVHKPGIIDSPSWTHAEFRRDPAKDMVLAWIRPLDRNAYFSSLRTVVERSERKEIFVFVHGFNNTFEDAVLRTAELFHDMDFQGAPVLFSWPSFGGGATGVPAYWRDRQNAKESARYLRMFLNLLADQSGADVIHVIAHSMGNFTLEQALVDSRTGEPRPLQWRRTKLHQVALAAADLDSDGVRRLASALAQSSDSESLRITAYASTHDRALDASVAANAGRIPFGLVTHDQPSVLPGVDVIDASALYTDMIGHVYWVEHRLGLADLRALLLEEFPPGPKRKLGQPFGKPWWTFTTPP
jgi:esterase/lipase superfamily enzyme